MGRLSTCPSEDGRSWTVAALFLRINVGTIRFLWYSEVVQSRLTRVTATPRERGPFYELRLVYQHAGADYTTAIHVAPEEATDRKEGDIVNVQFLSERPDAASLVYAHYPKKFVTAFSAFLAAAPLALVVKVVWDLVVTPWNLRRLLRRGEVVTGVIVDRKETTGKAASVKLTYAYEVPRKDLCELTSATVPVRTSMWVHGPECRSSRVGDSIAVVFDPDWLKKSAIYEYAVYEVIPETSPG